MEELQKRSVNSNSRIMVSITVPVDRGYTNNFPFKDQNTGELRYRYLLSEIKVEPTTFVTKIYVD